MTMDEKTRRRLEKAGWKVADATGFLELSSEDIAFLEMKLALTRSLRREREAQGVTQTALADLIGSSQSRVAKMEAGDSSVTIDLLIRAVLSLGLTNKDLSKILAKADRIAASV